VIDSSLHREFILPEAVFCYGIPCARPPFPISLVHEQCQARDALGWEAAVPTAELDGLLLFARALNIKGSVDYWVVQILLSSAEAAKRFHQDAYVDAIEVFKLLDKVFQSVGAEWHPLIKAGTDRLMPEFERVLERDNVGLSLSDLRAMKHLRTSQMAERVGYGQVFARQVLPCGTRCFRTWSTPPLTAY
jgi:hypothetical protein